MNTDAIMDMKDYIMDLVVAYGMKLIVSLIILYIGLKIASYFGRKVKAIMLKREVDESLVPFISSLTRTLLQVVVVISVLTTLGIEMTSFVAILGAAGFAIGMALSGTLQNFAGGVIILILRPFKVGDVVETQGYTGSVKAITIFNTILNTPDNKRILLPNGPVSTGALVNYSSEETRRVDFTFGIGYNDDIDQAKAVLIRIISENPKVLQDPAYFIAVSELADSSVNFVVRAWVKPADYWDVFFGVTETVKKEFDKEGISIPYPQQDIHLHQNS